MTLLRWQDNFNIGIEEVDHEHRELIELINTLHDSLAKDRSAAHVTPGKCLSTCATTPSTKMR